MRLFDEQIFRLVTVTMTKRELDDPAPRNGYTYGDSGRVERSARHHQSD